MDDIVDLLETRAREQPDRLLLAWEPFDGPPREWTYGAFLDEVRRVAGGLARRGVRPGDRVLLHANNCPEFLLTWFACAWLGAVCVVLNPKSASDELAFFADHTGAIGIVTQRGLPGTAPALRWRIAIDADDATGFASLRDTAAERAQRDPLAPGSMMFTSGTSSRPKAVVWTRANALWAAQSCAAGIGLLPSDIALVPLPLYHVVGLAWSVLPALQAGAAIVLQPRFSASRFWPVALARRCTFAPHVQFTSAALSRQPVPPAHDFRLWCNSVWLPDYERHFRVPILGWWGMTELVAPGIVGRRGEPVAPGAIGVVAPGYAARMAGSGRSSLTPGEIGEIEILGEPGRTLFAGYFNDDDANAAAFTDDGWFRTGDRMKVHADGSIQFLERARDVIKCGGEGVSPAEIERVVRAVPGVADVAVVGRADGAMGEVAVAFVVPSDPEVSTAALSHEIDAACRAQLAGFKVPREIRFLAGLPLVGINKVAKGELRRLAAAETSAPQG
ncbi:AMP-binding protein [Cupriavidus gilardii]|uniref:AMP-binding protein n=1 Tax=Cupriavidus gilardii TaxID=82541 RepID=UPI001572E6CD|nr:AMP-binding protein [Cupriavidus gilardii]NSX05991.1 AMP-binding protein [Cupriavidus gilardii]